MLKSRQNKRGSTLDATLRCTKCQQVYKQIIRSAKPAEFEVNISKGALTRRTRIEFDATLEFYVDDTIMLEGSEYLITAIEGANQQRLSGAVAAKIVRLWIKDISEINLKISVNRVQKTLPLTVTVPAQTEFTIGQQLTVSGLPIYITSMMNSKRVRLTHPGQSLYAIDIVRVYAREDRPYDSHRERKGRRDDRGKRQAPRRDGGWQGSREGNRIGREGNRVQGPKRGRSPPGGQKPEKRQERGVNDKRRMGKTPRGKGKEESGRKGRRQQGGTRAPAHRRQSQSSAPRRQRKKKTPRP